MPNDSAVRPEGVFTITDEKTCKTALVKIKGFLMLNDWDSCLTTERPIWDNVSSDGTPIEPSKAHTKTVMEWEAFNRKGFATFCLYLGEDDAEACEDMTAMEIQSYLKKKYLSQKQQYGINDSVHILRRTIIYENDSYETAVTKIGSITGAVLSLNRIKTKTGLAVSKLTEHVQIAFVIDALPPSCSMLRQNWLEKSIDDVSYTINNLRSSVNTFYRTAKPKKAAATPAAASQGSTVSTPPRGPGANGRRSNGGGATQSGGNHASGGNQAEQSRPAKNTSWAANNERIDRLVSQNDKIMLLLRRVAPELAPSLELDDNSESANETPKFTLLATSLLKEAASVHASVSNAAASPALPARLCAAVHTLDSASTQCFYKDQRFLHDLEKLARPEPIAVAYTSATEQCFAVGKGTLIVPVANGKSIRIPNAYFVPRLSFNLISEAALDRAGYTCVRGGGRCLVQDQDGSDLAAFPLNEGAGLYQLCEYGKRNNVPEERSLILGSQPRPIVENYQLWHARLGHLSLKDMSLLAKKHRDMPEWPSGMIVPVCSSCMVGKQRRTPSNRSIVPTIVCTEQCGQLLHMDIAGPFPESLGCSIYFAAITDDFSSFTFVRLLSAKKDLLVAFQQVVTLCERQQGHPVMTVKFDNAGEHQPISIWCRMKGIEVNPVAAYTPNLNGIAERVNRTLCDKYLPMLAHAKLPDRFWAEALRAACLLKNISPTSRSPDRISPWERWFKKVPDVSSVAVFGCVAWVHVQKHARQDKLDTKSIKCVNLGYFPEHRQYCCYDPETRRIVLSRNVTFSEHEFLVLPADAYTGPTQYRQSLPLTNAEVGGSSLAKDCLAVQGNRDGLRAMATHLMECDDFVASPERPPIDLESFATDPRFMLRLWLPRIVTNGWRL